MVLKVANGIQKDVSDKYPILIKQSFINQLNLKQ